MSEFAKIEGALVVEVIIADQTFIDGLTGEWVDITGEAGVGIGWGYNGSVFTAPAYAPTARFLLTGSEWVMLFTDDEWAWLKIQRAAATPAGKQLDRFMDAIRWTNSIDVSSESVDPFYTWLLNNGIPGGQTRIDELREGIVE